MFVGGRCRGYIYIKIHREVGEGTGEFDDVAIGRRTDARTMRGSTAIMAAPHGSIFEYVGDERKQPLVVSMMT